MEKILNQEASKLANIHLVYSTEKRRLEEFEKGFIDRFVSEEEQGFDLIKIEAEKNWLAQALNALNTLPVLSSRRFVFIKSSSMKDQQWKELVEAIPGLPSSSYLVLLHHGSPDGRLKAVKELKKKGVVKEIPPRQGKELREWIEKKFHQAGLRISREAVTLLESSFARAQGLLEQEIEKALLYFADRDQVVADDLSQIISRDCILEDKAIFRLVDYVGEKKSGPALSLLQEFLVSGGNEMHILVMVARQYRLILLSKELKQQGLGYKKIASRLNQHSYPIKKSLGQAYKYSYQELERALIRVNEANLDIIHGRLPPPLALELMIFDLTSK